MPPFLFVGGKEYEEEQPSPELKETTWVQRDCKRKTLRKREFEPLGVPFTKPEVLGAPGSARPMGEARGHQTPASPHGTQLTPAELTREGLLRG